MTLTPDTDPTPDYTPEEAAAVAAFDASVADEAASAQPAADPAPEPAAAAAPIDDASARLVEAASRMAAAADAIAARAAEPAAPAAPATPEPQPRDFNAELAALDQRFDDGDIDEAERRSEERRILREQAQADARAEVERANAEARQRAEAQAAQDAEAAWDSAQTAFFADAGNAALVADPIKAAAFKAAVDVVFAEKQGAITYPDLLVEARTRVTGVAPVAKDNAVRNATHERLAAQDPGARSLRDIPAAGSNDSAPGASLDHLPIDQLEDTLARMSDADRAAYLANAPGGLADNPRALS